MWEGHISGLLLLLGGCCPLSMTLLVFAYGAATDSQTMRMLLGPWRDGELPRPAAARPAVAALPAVFMSCPSLQIPAFGRQLLGGGPKCLCKMDAGLDSSASPGAWVCACQRACPSDWGTHWCGQHLNWRRGQQVAECCDELTRHQAIPHTDYACELLLINFNCKSLPLCNMLRQDLMRL